MNNIIDFKGEYEADINRLRKRIGNTCSENFSPTLHARLISINVEADTAEMEVVKSPYPAHSYGASKNHRAGERYTAPLYRIINAFLS